jgi:hypothetical protein
MHSREKKGIERRGNSSCLFNFSRKQKLFWNPFTLD